MTKRIDPPSLRANGKILHRVGRDIGDAVDALSSGTTSKNSPWGGDEFGSIFGSLYTPLAEKAFEFYREAGDAVDELGGALEKRASDHDETEHTNKKEIDGAGGD